MRLTRIARESSSLASSSAPTSSQLVPGTVANPSLLADGCTSCRANCVVCVCVRVYLCVCECV